MDPMRTGNTPKRTRVNNQPLANAITKPVIAIAITYKTMGILSLIAPWNETVSVENCDVSSDWFIKSNQPIYCRSKLRRYYFLQRIDCLSPVMSQQAIMIQPLPNTPIPISMKRTNMSRDSWTMLLASLNEFNMSPQSHAKMGIQAPLPMAKALPKNMRM